MASVSVSVAPGGPHQVTRAQVGVADPATVTPATVAGVAAIPVPTVGDTAATWAVAVASGDYDTVQGWYVSNTGYTAAGYAYEDLTDLGGSISSTYDGQVFEGLRGSRIQIQHDNVTVRGCLIVGGGTYGFNFNPSFGSSYTGTLVEYCTFFNDPAVDKAAILVGNRGAPVDATFRYCDVTGWSSGVLSQGATNVEYCYFHDFYNSSVEGAHVSSINAIGDTIRFHRNYAIEGGSNLASIYFDVRACHNIEITDNVLSARQCVSGNLPSYLLQGKTGAYDDTATGIVIGGNYLGDTIGTDFQYGQVSGFSAVPWGSNGNVRYADIDFLTGADI